MCPITAADGSGQIVDIYGRKTGSHLRKGTPLDMHLSDRGVWNVEAFKAGNEIILCSSLFDALTFWNVGYRNVTCMFGPEALTDDHLAAFQEFGIRSVLATSATVAPKLLAAGLDCYHILFPPDMDVNQYALQTADPSQALGAIIRKAEWLGKGQKPTVEVAPVAEPDNDNIEELDEANQLPAPILTASPVPPAPQEIKADISGDEVAMQLGHRHYRVRGLSKNLSFDQLKVNVLASTEKGMYVDTFDLYLARHRRQFTVQAAIELGVEEQTIIKDLGRVLLKLEQLQDEQITKLIEPKESCTSGLVWGPGAIPGPTPLFIGSVAAGERAADFMTLVSSAVRNDLDVWAYIKDVLDQLLSGSTDYESLRPDIWKQSHPESIRTYRTQERRDRADRKQRRRSNRRSTSQASR